MKITAKGWFTYEEKLTEPKILRIAQEIGEIRRQIDEIEASRKTLKDLQNKIVILSRQLEQGKITSNFYGIHSYHDPIENFVTISPDPSASNTNYFQPFSREMTNAEKEKYCQHILDFNDPSDLETEVEVKQNFDARPGFEEDHKKGDYFIKAPNPNSPAFVWDVFLHCGHGTEPDHIGTFYRESDAIQKVRELRNEAERKQTTTDQTTPDIPAEPEPLSSLHVYKSPTGQYYFLDAQLFPVKLKVLNSLENVVFLEQEGVEGVILKRHSEITPGNEIA